MKKILAVLLVLLILVTGFFAWRYFNDWTLRYHSELDRFFGEGNWRCVDSEEKESILASKYVHTASALGGETVPETYTDWVISFRNRDGEEEIWRITDHSLVINHDRYGIFEMNKRLNGKQALTLELMDISIGVASEGVKEDVLLDSLSSAEAACFEVTISWKGGNPKPEFYDDLRQKLWFRANEVTAADYLSCDDHDFFLDIRAHDYRLAKLDDAQRQNVVNSFDTIIEKLCQIYGDDASFRLYIDSGHIVEYRNGAEVNES